MALFWLAMMLVLLVIVGFCQWVCASWELKPPHFVTAGPSDVVMIILAGASAIVYSVYMIIAAAIAQSVHHALSPLDFAAVIAQPMILICGCSGFLFVVCMRRKRSPPPVEDTELMPTLPGYSELPDTAEGELHLQLNKWGEHEEPSTHMVFDLATKAVRGKMNYESGTVDSLTEADIAMCTQRGWSYTKLVSDTRSPPVLIT